MEGAITDYTRSIKLKNPKLHLPYNNRGNVHRGQGNLVDAIADYDEAIRIKPDYVTAYHNRGLVRQMQNNFEKAFNDYQEALELKPNDGVARMSLFGLLKKMGREEEAKEQEALARELIEKEDEYNRACFESLCGNIDEALALLKIALAKKDLDKAWARQDPDLEKLRDDKRFRALVGE